MTTFEKEQDKYVRAYRQSNYKMGETRKLHATRIMNKWPLLNELNGPKTLLDVGCGRGEIVEWSNRKGFKAIGTEIVPYLIDKKQVVYAEINDLPFGENTFDYITCLDVIEHLLPGVEIEAFNEFKRVARDRILMTIANFPSRGLKGEELHINIKPYQEWDNILREIFSDAEVIWHPKRGNISETWEVILT